MFNYVIDLYNRAMKNQKLTAHERAILKVVQGAIIGFIASFIPQFISVMLGHAQFNFTAQGVNTLIVAFAMGLLKLWAAQSDTHLGDVLDAYSKQLEQQGIGEVVTTTDGVTQIPAVHIVVPTVHATAAQSTVQMVVPAQQGTGTASVVMSTGNQSRQFTATPGVPLAIRSDQDTQPNVPVPPPSDTPLLTPLSP